MSQDEIAESLALLEKEWDIDPLLRDFMLQKIPDIEDKTILVRGVIFHIPYIRTHQRFVLWKCHWPDCDNCCKRQGRLPLTSDDIITIGAGLKYSKKSEFLKNETLLASWRQGDKGPLMTTINLKRRQDETEADDGTRVPCRFLDGEGACTLHPGRPGVCRLYPFSTWLENEGGRARVHAAYQITGDCPGFHLAESLDEMRDILTEYAGTIYEYNMSTVRTHRESWGAASF